MNRSFYLRAVLMLVASVLITGLVVTQGYGVHNSIPEAPVDGKTGHVVASAQMDWVVLGLLLAGGTALVLGRRRKVWDRKS